MRQGLVKERHVVRRAVDIDGLNDMTARLSGESRRRHGLQQSRHYAKRHGAHHLFSRADDFHVGVWTLVSKWSRIPARSKRLQVGNARENIKPRVGNANNKVRCRPLVRTCQLPDSRQWAVESPTGPIVREILPGQKIYSRTFTLRRARGIRIFPTPGLGARRFPSDE